MTTPPGRSTTQNRRRRRCRLGVGRIAALPFPNDAHRFRRIGVVGDGDCNQAGGWQFTDAALQVLALNMRRDARLPEQVHDHVRFDVVGCLVDALHVVRAQTRGKVTA